MHTQVAFLLILSSVFCEIVRYDGHKVIRVQAKNDKQLNLLALLYENSTLDFWTVPSLLRPTDIRVSPDEYGSLVSKFSHVGMNATIVHDDVQELIESLGQHPNSTLWKRATTDILSRFPQHSEVYNWLLSQSRANPSIAQLYSIGRTYESRKMSVLKIGSAGMNKPVIWLDAGIHAREWITVAATLNIIDMIIKGYRSGDSSIKSLVDKFDWYILPIANPDGYEYTFSSGGRLWRKTRTPYQTGFAYGADPNRNWGYHWGTTGVSHYPSRDTYAGPRAFSEKCVQNMQGALSHLSSRMKVYMTLHSYGQMWFLPYAYSKTAFPNDYNHMKFVATEAVRALKQATNRDYAVGRVSDLLYEASGSTMDWVKGNLKVPYAFGMELRPDQNNANGFIARASDIKPAAQETFEALKVVARLGYSKPNFQIRKVEHYMNQDFRPHPEV